MPNPDKIFIAIGGGKGGVGKSIVSSNLAVALARLGKRTVLVDADLGAANQHTMFGLDRTGPTLHGIIQGQHRELSEILVETGTPGLLLAPGCGAIPGAANLEGNAKARLMEAVINVSADVVLIDVGAGISFDVIDLYNLADLRLVVVLPQLTSFQNAYAFLKAAVHRSIDGAADTQARRELYQIASPPSETDRIPGLLTRLREHDPTYARMAKARLQHFGVELIGNQIVSPKERGTLVAVAKMFQDFLGIEANQLGHLRFNRRFGESINARRPLIQLDPLDDCSRGFMQMAQTLLSRDVLGLRKGRTAADEAPAPIPEAALIADLHALLRA
jgi:flagellar biosynthesis protein FlhG